MIDVCVIGMGYIGLPTAGVLAASGLRVHGADTNPRVVASVLDGRAHVVEPGLEPLVRAAVKNGRLSAGSSPVPARVQIIAVPTPFGRDHAPDLTYVHAAADAVAPHLRAGDLVVLESTVSPGTTEELAARIQRARPDLRVAGTSGAPRPDVHVAHCPERVLPGRILEELSANDRVVGGVDAASTEAARAFYASFVKGRVLGTDSRTAELCKLAENAFRDVNIAYANELSLICDTLGVDVWELIALANHHPRVKIMQPGPGVGGHCIAVDPWFIVAADPRNAKLVRTAREVNDAKPAWVLGKVLDAARARHAKEIACLGLSFKADVDDLRQSPAVEVVRQLAGAHDGRIAVVEPHAAELPRELAPLKNVRLVGLPEALRTAELVVLLVNHASFADVPTLLRHGQEVVDTRGMWRGLVLPRGTSIGRGRIKGRGAPP